MKKALKINLSGQIFHIDEDAYEKLKIYLDTISSHFLNAQESKEIISDIETRIAELFSERIKDGNQVISISNVEEIIQIMGKPEEIASEEEEPDEQTSRSRSYRRLYRDPDNSVLGGVSSGLGAYFNIDTLIIRILFVVLVLIGAGFPVLLYLILWIAVPKAKTATEKLEMRGEKVNVSNIEKTVRDEYENVKQNLRKAKDSDTFKRTENFFEEFFRVIGSIILALLKIFLVFIGIIFAVTGIGIIIGFIALLFFGVHFLPLEVYQSMKFDYISPFISPGNLSLLAISFTLLIAIPVLSVVYALFKAIFKFKTNNKALGLSAFALWILALVTAISMVIFEAREFSENETLSNTTVLADFNSNTLVLEADTGREEMVKRKESFTLNKNQYYFQKEGIIYGRMKVDVKKSPSENFEIEIEKKSKGYDERAALENAESILYNYSLRNNNLVLSSLFSIPSGDKWRFQEVEVTVFVPEGDTIVLDKSMKDHLDGLYNTAGYSSWRMAGNTWVMGEKGLEIIE